MPIESRVKKVGGSLCVFIPRDVARVMGVVDGTEIRLTVVGQQLVVEPAEETVPDEVLRRAVASVLRRGDSTFKALADYDRGIPLPSRSSGQKKSRR